MREDPTSAEATLAVSVTVTMVTTQSTTTRGTSERITVMGTLAEEMFEPTCLAETPPCLGPLSYILPILVAETARYLLAADDTAMRQQLSSVLGLRVKVSGNIQPFNASTRFPGYRCSPYTCDSITNEISVTAIEVMTSTTSAVGTTTPAIISKPIPGFPAASMAVGLVTGVLAVLLTRRIRRWCT